MGPFPFASQDFEIGLLLANGFDPNIILFCLCVHEIRERNGTLFFKIF